jgi:hypothetical protein
MLDRCDSVTMHINYYLLLLGVHIVMDTRNECVVIY